MDAKQTHRDDEAGRIRRWSPGASQQAHDGGANAAISIDGGFWMALITLVAVVVLAVRIEMHEAAMSKSASDAVLAAERADQAAAASTLAREYAVAAFYQTQMEWAKRGVELQPRLGHHEPIPTEAYEQFERETANDGR